jgi:hypothetical protein
MMRALLNKSRLPMYYAGTAIDATFLKLRKAPIALFFVKHGPVIAALLVAISFTLTRPPFFLHFRLIEVAIDYWS